MRGKGGLKEDDDKEKHLRVDLATLRPVDHPCMQVSLSPGPTLILPLSVFGSSGGEREKLDRRPNQPTHRANQVDPPPSGREDDDARTQQKQQPQPLAAVSKKKKLITVLISSLLVEASSKGWRGGGKGKKTSSVPQLLLVRATRRN